MRRAVFRRRLGCRSEHLTLQGLKKLLAFRALVWLERGEQPVACFHGQLIALTGGILEPGVGHGQVLLTAPAVFPHAGKIELCSSISGVSRSYQERPGPLEVLCDANTSQIEVTKPSGSLDEAAGSRLLIPRQSQLDIGRMFGCALLVEKP
jgi:hypothetical protein